MTEETLRRAIGQRVRAIREAHGVRQDDVAEAARGCGLKWHATRVAALERGDKAIPIEEFFLLSTVLLAAGCGDPSLADLLPEDGDQFVLVGDVQVAARSLRRLLVEPAGALPGADVHTPADRKLGAVLARAMPALADAQRFAAVVAPEDWTAGHLRQALTQTARQAEQIASRRFGVPVGIVAVAAAVKWGRSLTEERDARVSDAAAPGTDARSLQAMRGRVTRALYDELAPVLARYSPAPGAGAPPYWPKDRDATR